MKIQACIRRLGLVVPLRLSAALVGLVLLSAGPAGAVKVEKMIRVQANGQSREVEVTAGEALVQFDPALPAAQRAALLAVAGAQVIRELPTVGWTQIGLSSGTPVAAALDILRGLSGVKAVAPNHVYRALRTPNDPLISTQYHLNKIDAYHAWDYEVGDSSMATIAVMDSGIQGSHPELVGKLVGVSQYFNPDAGSAQSADNTGPGGTPTAACPHATEVAGVAAATTNDAFTVAGVSWGAKLISLKVFNNADCNPADCNAAASCGTNDADIITAIDWAKSNLAFGGYGRLIINMSLGAPESCPTALQTSVTNAVSSGVVIVAASGNALPSCSVVQSPANCAGVIPVGATDSSDNVASFSCSGPELAANGVVAPGVGIRTTGVNNSTTSVDGTSFASPIVAGLAALMLSNKPALTPATVQTVLRNSTELVASGASSLAAGVYKTQGNAQGAGRVNANNAMILTVKGQLNFTSNSDSPIIFPNPFHPVSQATTTVVLPTGTKAAFKNIKIYTMDGHLVRTLKGQTWDGNNDGGKPVVTGTYIVLVTTDSRSFTGKVAVVR